MPDLPREQWCDIRTSYIEKDLTLSELAEIYRCDSRTIKACLIRNKSSKSLGKKSTPTRIDLCRNELQDLLRQHLNELPEDVHSVYQLSCYLLPLLKKRGYSGSERTLRNYLHSNPSVKAIFEKGISTHDQDQKHEYLVGVTILGDYEDLSALRDALYHYTDLFLSNQDHPDAYNCHECILGLCYDIRHAYQGDRDFEAVPNNAENIAMLAKCIYKIDTESKESIDNNREAFKNGNLYFSVDILYPWAIYYLYVLQAITDIPCESSWYGKLTYPYDEYQAEHDMALIQYFVQLLWSCVKTVLPPKIFKVLWDYTRTFNHTEYYISCPELYVQWLSNYWASQKQSRETRVSLLPMLFLELSSIDSMGEDSMLEESSENDDRFNEFVQSINQTTRQCLDLYDNYYALVQSISTLPFYSSDEFYSTISEYVDEHGPFTEESFDEYLDDTIGKVDWDDMEW